MPVDKVDIHALDAIFSSMVRSLDQSKHDIFIINEESRQQLEELKEDLRKTDEEISRAITEGEKLSAASLAAREKLQHVSIHFADYTNDEVREAYDSAHEVQLEFMLNSTKIRQLTDLKRHLENRVRTYEDSMERADHLAGHVNVVTKYLTSDLKDIGPALESAKMRKHFSMKVLEAQEEERKRLAREIHDGPAQMMANLVMQLGLVERVFNDKGMDAGLDQLSFTKELARHTLSEIRRIIYDLRPMVLDDFGLVPALSKYVEKMQDYHPDMRFTFESNGTNARIPQGTEVAVFRLVQEAVTNAIKHSGAYVIDVRIEICENWIRASVTDDGSGFDPSEAGDASFGLQGMTERVALLKGEFEIRTKKGEGTEVILTLPHEQRATEKDAGGKSD
ncbi:sensor histidine kinase [Bhargavaea beijingensis]|uniref:histidine kinase n=1 Tax=Bhargavaea beijingensis TaxID=426756 RepID=A0A1G7BWF3_9BACL|nr:sensor histidine kinase [Bhargavaea beijingensis]MCW1926684.1 sensor histidine kinase [Bhargavaea beijingensis]SDE30706.1 two-component system, NarL family, sensor histidine kinase DegS [Bhargavaea beijingensis]